MLISKQKGWYTIEITENEPIHFHQLHISRLQDALDYIRTLQEKHSLDNFDVELDEAIPDP